MKRVLILFSGLGLAVFSCQSDQPVTPLRTTSPQNTWVTIDLNIDYSIQFPADSYQGKGYTLYQGKGNTSGTPTNVSDIPTSINRKDQQANLYATFCNPNAYPCRLIQYGQALASPLPKSVPYLNSKGESSLLDHTIGFTKGGNLIGILYYTNDPTLTLLPYRGQLYLLSNSSGSFEFAGRAIFSETTKQELFDILSTLSPK
ncbi:hypothetical protein SAMN05216167_1596 [Spirosoma endophyticum]|uniref:Lipoprotein n=1 Tax=Spirosoma endophyticum TaxID=662367 RepID=A0A1I2IBD6_9BACT|nr:hypothetical protein SAMN05216167_1596 [Spirosoma endophyticum]